MRVCTQGRPYSAVADKHVRPDSCTSSNSGVLSADPTSTGCAVSFNLGGGPSFTVTASYNGLSFPVAYRAYSPNQFVTGSTRSNLRRLGCGYESAFLTAVAEITLDGSSFQWIDISDLVSFSSSSPVVSIMGRIAQGQNVGSATITFGPGQVGAASLTVSPNSGTITSVVSYAFTDALVTHFPVTNSEAEATMVNLKPVLSLTAEGQSAWLISYALADDGVWTDISASPFLALAPVSAADMNITKVGSYWKLLIPPGASSVSGSASVITGTLKDSCGQVLNGAGVGYAMSNLSVPIAITVTSAAASIARPASAAASALGFAVSTQLTVTVTFRSSSGTTSSRDFTTDPRTLFTPTFTAAAGSVSPNGLLTLNSGTGSGAGLVVVQVTIPSYAAANGLTGTVSIPVVDVNTAVALTGSLVHTMTPSVAVTSGSKLSQLACTGVYQTGSLSSVTVTLTDGSTRSGTPSLTSSNTAVATVSGTTVTPVASGSSTITATYASATGTFTAYVSSTSVSVTSIALSYGSSTLSGQTGATMSGSAAVSFSDGTSFSNAIGSFSPISTLLGFNSSDTSSITISSSGVVSLVNNSWLFSTLTAYSKCGDGHVSTFSMAGNLAPVAFDTKLGSSSGLTFPAASLAGTVSANIQVRASSNPMTSYQIWLFYNSAVFNDPVIVKGSGWSVGSFSSSVNNAVGGSIVKAILSFASGSSATNSLVPMASVSFTVKTSSAVLELITANVVALSDTGATRIQSATGVQIVAGTAFVSLNGGSIPQFRRLLSVDSLVPEASRHLLQASLPLVTGDCNGDGYFNANDATYAQALLTNGAGTWPTSSIVQMRNCAPTYSYMFNRIKASYSSSDIQVTVTDSI